MIFYTNFSKLGWCSQKTTLGNNIRFVGNALLVVKGYGRGLKAGCTSLANLPSLRKHVWWSPYLVSGSQLGADPRFPHFYEEVNNNTHIPAIAHGFFFYFLKNIKLSLTCCLCSYVHLVWNVLQVSAQTLPPQGSFPWFPR